MTSHHCEAGRHDVCLDFYAGEKCDCICHVELVPRRGWAEETE